MPGVNVTTGVRVGPTGTAGGPASTFFVVGTAERGPIDEAVVVTGMSQFEAIYGGYDSDYTLHDYVKTFFEEGGNRACVARVAGTSGSAAATATVNITDSATPTPGVVLTLDAANPGVWANSSASPLKDGLKAIVATVGSGFTIQITYRGATVFTGGPFLDEVLEDGSTKKAKQFAAEAINASAVLANLVTATVGSSTAAPAAATKLFAGGSEGGTVTDAELVDGLDLLDYDFGPGAVAIPGTSTTDAWDGLRDHAVANRRIALCAFGDDDDKATAIGAADGYWGDTTAERTQGSYMAFYWPWVKVPDGFGGTRIQSPEALAAAARARAHSQTGPWRAGAGEVSTAVYVTGLATPVTKADGDELDDNRVNALRVINNSVRVYGARSISSDDANWRYITYRDTLNYITGRAETALEPLVFRPIDGRGNLFGEIEAILTGIMEPIRAAGGVFEGTDPVSGRVIDSGYTVSADAANNPPANLANGEVSAIISARVSPVADKINITITKSAINAVV